MGMYTGIRFKGYVKEEFRNDFDTIALAGEWENHKDSVFSKFGEIGRSSFIPCGCLSYMPDEWEDDNERATDGFIRTWNAATGFWTFQCSLKNYEDEIETWLEILPYFIEKIDHLETYYEGWNYSKKWDLVGNKIVLVNDKFIQYR